MSSTAFFGKLPMAADFVRFGVSAPAVRHFEKWFHDAYGDLRATGARGLAERFDMIVPDPEMNAVVVAVAVPSRDRVGREFPGVVATVWPGTTLHTSQAAGLLGVSRFCDDAARTVAEHRDGSPDDLWQAVQSLRPLTQSELSEAEQRANMLLGNSSARDMEDACFPEQDNRFYAYHTLRLAVADVPPRETRVLVCPTAGKPEYRAFWAEAVGRSLKQNLSPSWMWFSGEERSGMLAALGRPPSSMIAFAGGAGGRSNALWPLFTAHESARQRAKNALAAQPWDDSAQTFSSLLDAISRIQL